MFFDEDATDELQIGMRIRFMWPPDLYGVEATVYDLNPAKHTAAVRLDDGRVRYGHGRFFEIVKAPQ